MAQTQTETDDFRAALALRSRSPLVRSRRSNNPLLPPKGLVGSELRRWRDLTAHYVGQLGDRIRREDVRVLVSSLVSLTLMAERLHDRVARNEPVDPNWVIQSTQTIVRLLAELGLKPVEVDRPPSSLLSNYLKEAAE